MCAKERLNNILLSENVSKKIDENLDFILATIPEILDMIAFEHKNPGHHLDVYKHTLKALEYSDCDLIVRMSLLLHDIGKPSMYQEIKGIRHFRGHPEESEKIAKKILKRLDYDKEFISDVCYIVRWHDEKINTKNLDTNIELIKKRLEVQFCDAKAHHPDVVPKRLEMLEKIKDELYK